MTLVTYHALMLSLANFRPASPDSGGTSANADDKKVFSAVVVFVPPLQKLSSIEDAVDMLLVISCDPAGMPVAALCCLPKQGIGEFYPCLGHDAALVLPFGMSQDGRILYLNTSIHHCDEFAIWHLHWWVHPFGPVLVLPPLYSPDPGLPSIYLLNKPAMLWTNTKHLAVLSNYDDDVCEVGHPAMTFVSTSHLKVNAKSSLISLTNEKFIQYYTIDIDTNNSSTEKSNEAANVSESQVTPKKTRKKKVVGDTKDDCDPSSNSQDDGMCSESGSQHPSLGVGFQGWSSDKGEGDITAAVANKGAELEWDQHDSSVRMGSDNAKPQIVPVVPEG